MDMKKRGRRWGCRGDCCGDGLGTRREMVMRRTWRLVVLMTAAASVAGVVPQIQAQEEEAVDLSPRALAFGDRFCDCDLRPDVCDINCCCDRACTAEEIDAFFSEPCATRAVEEPELIESCDVSDERLMLEQPSVWDWLRFVLCIVRRNPIDTEPFRQLPQSTNPVFGPSSFLDLPEDSTSTSVEGVEDGVYQQGDTLLVATSDPAALNTAQPFTVPGSVLGQGCGAPHTVRFLDDVTTTTCVRKFANGAALEIACASTLSVQRYTSAVANVIADPSSLQRVSIAAPASPLPTTAFANGTCVNAAQEISITFVWNTQGITTARVEATAANVTSDLPLLQRFRVRFLASLDAQQQSGRPGYVEGSPVLFLDHTYALPLVLSSSRYCSEVGKRNILFGENTLASCDIEFPITAFNDCDDLRTRFREALGVPASSFGRVGVYGDSQQDRGEEWVPLINNTVVDDQGAFIHRTGLPSCDNMPTRVELQLLVTEQGHPSNRQRVIFGAQLTSYTRHVYVTQYFPPQPPSSNSSGTSSSNSTTQATATASTPSRATFPFPFFNTNFTVPDIPQVRVPATFEGPTPRQRLSLSFGVSFVRVDAEAASLQARRNSVPTPCYRGACWHAPYRAGQRTLSLSDAADEAQAHYATTLAHLMALVLGAALAAASASMLYAKLP